MKTLFDFDHGTGSGNIMDTFLEKLGSINKDYVSLLGEDTVEFAQNVVIEYKNYLIYKEEIQTINEKYLESIKGKNLITKSTFEYGHFDSEKADKNVSKSIKYKIIAHIREKWHIEISEYLFNTTHEEEGSVKVDYLSEENILEFIASKTNNGNGREISKEQMLNSLSKDVGQNIKLVKKTVQLNQFYSLNMSYQSPCISHWCEKKGFYKALLAFCKEDFLGSCKNTSHIGTIESIYSFSPRGYQGDSILDKQEFTGNFIVSTKLLKNGRFDIEFKTEDLAKRFYQDYLVECKKDR